MWLFALFDVPVDSKAARRNYARFRKALLKEGFTMLQYSVYARYFPSEQAAAPYKQRIRGKMPPQGQVRLLAVTERQFARQEVFQSAKPRDPEAAEASQLMLF